MIKNFIIYLLFLFTSCSTYTVTVLHNEVDPVTFLDADTEIRKKDPRCKKGMVITTNKNKKEGIHR